MPLPNAKVQLWENKYNYNNKPTNNIETVKKHNPHPNNVHTNNHHDKKPYSSSINKDKDPHKEYKDIKDKEIHKKEYKSEHKERIPITKGPRVNGFFDAPKDNNGIIFI